MGGKLKFKLFAKSLFHSQLILWNNKNDLIRILHSGVRFNFFFFFFFFLLGSANFDAKILLQCKIGNNELTWAKSIKFISCYIGEKLEFNSFFKNLILDFLWQISSCHNFNWHCSYAQEALRDWILQQKLSLHCNKNSKCSSALRRRHSRFSNFRFLLSVLWPYLPCKMFIDLYLRNRNRIRNKITIAAIVISIFDGKLTL